MCHIFPCFNGFRKQTAGLLGGLAGALSAPAVASVPLFAAGWMPDGPAVVSESPVGRLEQTDYVKEDEKNSAWAKPWIIQGTGKPW